MTNHTKKQIAAVRADMDLWKGLHKLSKAYRATVADLPTGPALELAKLVLADIESDKAEIATKRADVFARLDVLADELGLTAK